MLYKNQFFRFLSHVMCVFVWIWYEPVISVFTFYILGIWKDVVSHQFGEAGSQLVLFQPVK